MRVAREATGGVRIDRGTADEVRGTVIDTEKSESGDDDLHLRTNRTQRPLPVTGGSGIECRRPGKQQIAEHVGADLIDPPPIRLGVAHTALAERHAHGDAGPRSAAAN